MIKVKSIFDPVEADDGVRIRVEPIGLTRDLQQWCDVDYVLSELGPPLWIWNQLRAHPDHYGSFNVVYESFLSQEPRRDGVARLAVLSTIRQITLLHEGDDPELNSATALCEFVLAWQQPAGR